LPSKRHTLATGLRSPTHGRATIPTVPPLELPQRKTDQ
jgi:hypothetical protein